MKANEVFKDENIGKMYHVSTQDEYIGIFEIDSDGDMFRIDTDVDKWWLQVLLSSMEIVNANYEEIKE